MKRTFVVPRGAVGAGHETALCACGHEQNAHTHYRRGSDCGICGHVACARYRASHVLSPVRPSGSTLTPSASRGN
jgi:hypothetical protein